MIQENPLENNILSFEKKQQEVRDEQARKTKVINDCAALMAWCEKEGMPVEEAFPLVDELKKGIDTYYSYWDNIQGIQKSLTVEWLEKYTKWASMGRDERSDLLWGIGFDTKKFATGQMKRLVMHNKKEALTEVVYGMERGDKEWLNLRHDETYEHYASFEARTQATHHRYGGISVKATVGVGSEAT